MQQLRYIGDQGNMLVNSKHILGPLHISLCARFLHSSVLRPISGLKCVDQGIEGYIR